MGRLSSVEIDHGTTSPWWSTTTPRPARTTAGPAASSGCLADEAYSHPSTRTELRSRGITCTIPERKDQIARRKAKGSAEGRPPAFDAAHHGLRNTVERGFNRLNQWHGVATCYDKYALTYLRGVLLACALITPASAPPNREIRPSRSSRIESCYPPNLPALHG